MPQCLGLIREINPVIDTIILLFLIGQIVEESREFFTEPRYVRSVWNQLDCGVILALSVYFVFMEHEWVCCGHHGSAAAPRNPVVLQAAAAGCYEKLAARVELGQSHQ